MGKNKEKFIRNIVCQSIKRLITSTNVLESILNDDPDDLGDLEDKEFYNKYGKEFKEVDRDLKSLKNIDNDEKLEDETPKNPPIAKSKPTNDEEDRILSSSNPGIKEFNSDMQKVKSSIKSYLDKYGRDPTILEIKIHTNPTGPTSLKALLEFENTLEGNTFHLNQLRMKYPNGLMNLKGHINYHSIKANSPELYNAIKTVVDKIKKTDKKNRDSNRLDVILGKDELTGYNFHNRHSKDILIAFNSVFSLCARFFDELSRAIGFKYKDILTYDDGKKIIPSKIDAFKKLVDDLEEEPNDPELDKKVIPSKQNKNQ